MSISTNNENRDRKWDFFQFSFDNFAEIITINLGLY